MPDPEDTELRKLVAAQQEAIDELRYELDQLRGDRRRQIASPEPPEDDRALSRRALFGLAGAGIAGVAVGGAASPAAAANGDSVVLGQINEATATTRIAHTTGHEYPVVSGVGLAVSNAGDSNDEPAILGETVGHGAGVAGRNTAEFGGAGVQGTANGGLSAGVQGTSDCVGVWGRVLAGGEHNSLKAALFGNAEATDAFGVIGNSVYIGTAGISGGGHGIAGQSTSGSSAYLANEVGPHLYLERIGTEHVVGPPMGAHHQGMISLDSAGDLFLCVAEGDPGTWTRLNHQGPALLSTPQRAFDSRSGRHPVPGGATKGRFGQKETRVVDLTIATDVGNDATAVVLNVTVTNTAATGFVSIYAADETMSGTPSFSTVNWFGAGQTLANTTLAKTSGGRIKVFAHNPTDVIIDVIAVSR